MLWLWAAALLTIWLVAKFLLHKGGYVHILLLMVIAFVITQVVHDRRTRAQEPPNR